MARLEITPGALLMTAAGQTAQLRVHAYDQAGKELQGVPLVFESSRPAELTVDQAGVVRAEVMPGSALIRARSGSVSAPAVMAMAARPVEGAVLVSDAQILSEPVASSPTEPRFTGGRYHVTLNMPPPSPGTVLVGSGVKPLGGKVVSASATGSGADVELEIVPLPELLRTAKIDLRFAPSDLRLQDLLTPPAGTRIQPGLVQPPALKFAKGPLECEGSIDPAALSIELEQKVTSTLEPQFVLEIEDSTVSRFALRIDGGLEAEIKATLGLGAALTAEATCKLKVARAPIPVTGVLAIVVAPGIPISVKVALSAATQVELFQFGAQAKQAFEISTGIEYTAAGGFDPIARVDVGSPEVNFTTEFPSSLGLRVKSTVFAGPATGLDFGGILGTGDLVEVSSGPEFEAKFGTPYDVSSDPIYNSEYELKARAAVGPGQELQELIKWVFGHVASVELGLKWEDPLARSPQATTVAVDAADFVSGDDLTFTVELDPATVDFPIVGYNVGEIRIYRLDHSIPGAATQIASAPAAAGQVSFSIPWTATFDGPVKDRSSGKPAFYAFVVPVFLSTVANLLPVELGEVLGSPPSGCADPGIRFCATSVGSMPRNEDLGVFLTNSDKALVTYQQSGFGYLFEEGQLEVGIRGNHQTLFARSGTHVAWGPGPDPMSSIYTSTDVAWLPKTGPDGDYTWTIVNDGRWAAGYATQGGVSHAVRLDGNLVDAGKNAIGTVEALDVQGSSGADDMDEAGVIVGSSDGSIFIWSAGAPTTYLAPPAGTVGCFSASRNDVGDVVANCAVQGGTTHMFVWWGGQGTPQLITGTPDLVNFTPVPRMNSSRQMVGAKVDANKADILLWENGVTTSILDNTAFNSSFPFALFPRAWINNRGNILVVQDGDLYIPALSRTVYLLRENPAFAGR